MKENNQFNEETCIECGECLHQCPFLNLPLEEAQQEISKIIETKASEKILKNCAGCLYCNVICPTHSYPSALTKEILLKEYRKSGVEGLKLTTEDNPNNFMSLTLEGATEERKREVEKFSNPPKSKIMHFLGCSISYMYPDLTKSVLLEDLPSIGGITHCCGGYANNYFGENEARIKGTELFEKFKKYEVEKLITYCPGCTNMISKVLPSIVDGYNIESQGVIEYLIEKYHQGKLKVKNKINQRITFQDPCRWREVDKKIYESPRELLEILGCEVTEMKHNKEKSLCCSSPISVSNQTLAKKIQRKNISEAKEAGADAIAFVCPGCISFLAKGAAKKKIGAFYITELAQLAIGEKISHKILESMEEIQNLVIRKILDNPSIMSDKYVLLNGKLKKI